MYKFRVFWIFFIFQYGFSNAIPKFRSSRLTRNAAAPSVEVNSPLEIRNVGENSNDEVRAFYTYPTTILKTEPPEDSKPAKRHFWHLGCRDNADRSTRSLENFDNHEDSVELEVRQGGQTQQQQPMPTQQQQPQPMPMPMQQQQPPMTMPMQQQQQPVPMPMQPQPGQMPQATMQMPTNQQLPQMQMQTPQMHMPPAPGNMVGGSPQMHPDGQYHSPYPQQQMPGMTAQPPVGYPMPAPYTNPSMGWPANTGANPFPANTAYPYNAYPPTGQMQLPIPPNQFAGYGPPSPYTNPVYNTPLGSNQNDMEAQIASAFLSTQMSNMMRDPTTREAMLYLVSELRSFLSNPNAIPLMRAMNHRAQEVMNMPGLYNQHGPQNIPHGTSTIVQVQDGANHLLDKVKAKGGKIMSFVKEIADANSRMLEDTTADIPVVNSVVKIGTGLANAGVGMVDGFLSPWLHTSGGNRGTTITTVSTPQTGYPNTQYQTPTSITVGK